MFESVTVGLTAFKLTRYDARCLSIVKQYGNKLTDQVNFVSIFDSTQHGWQSSYCQVHGFKSLISHRLGFVMLMLLAMETNRQALINVNNRVEGNAPSSITAVLHSWRKKWERSCDV